jgi:hypothetical protein
LHETDEYAKNVHRADMDEIGKLAAEMNGIRKNANKATLEKIREIGLRNAEWWAVHE